MYLVPNDSYEKFYLAVKGLKMSLFVRLSVSNFNEDGNKIGCKWQSEI